MKSSAFSGLSLTDQGAPLANGVDQRLFGPSPASLERSTSETTQQRDNATTLPRSTERTNAGVIEPALPRLNAIANTAPTTRSDAPAGKRAYVTTGAATHEPASERAPARTVERHSHDVFRDQVRWMNRVKLDLEEQYGVKVTSNGIVQLALDLFREDFIRNGEGSSLIRVLVHAEPRRTEVGRRDATAPLKEEADP